MGHQPRVRGSRQVSLAEDGGEFYQFSNFLAMLWQRGKDAAGPGNDAGSGRPPPVRPGI